MRATPPSILLTGAGGFLGGAVGRVFAARGVPLRTLHGPGDPPPSPEAFDAWRGEIDDARLLERLLQGIDVVLHLAGPPSVARSFQEPAETCRVHVLGTARLLEACRGAGVRRCVYISSAEVYGESTADASEHPRGEMERPAPSSPYGVAKLAAETLVQTCAGAWGLEAVILRPFSLYGPGAGPDALVPTILRQVRHQTEIVLADLSPVRDYCYVDDCAQAIALAAEAPLPRREATYNVASGRGVSVQELAELALQVAGRRAPLRQTAMDRPESSRRSCLIGAHGRIEQDLGWRATTSLPEGLAQTYRAIGGSPS